MAFLPVPITAVHTTSRNYCFGEGLLSRFTDTNATLSIITDAILGRVFRFAGGGAVAPVAGVEIDIPAGTTGLTFGLFMWVNGGSPTAQNYIRFLNAGGSTVFHFATISGGTWRAVRGSTVVSEGTTQLGQGGSGGQHFFEGSIEFDDTNGRVAWRANVGDLEMDESNVDTLNAAGPVTKMIIGPTGTNSNPTRHTEFGHGYVRARNGTDNFYGRGITRYLPYTADVAVDFTPTGTGSNNNDRIKELDPDGDTTRVSSSTDGDEDTYGPPDASAITGAVKVLWNYQGCKQDGSALLHSVITPDGASKDVETDGRLVPFGGYGGIATAYETIPGTANPWSGADISAIDAIGFQLEVP